MAKVKPKKKSEGTKAASKTAARKLSSKQPQTAPQEQKAVQPSPAEETSEEKASINASNPSQRFTLTPAAPSGPSPKPRSGVGKAIGAIVGIIIFIVIIFAIGSISTPKLSATPTILNGSWVNQFFVTASNARGKAYYECPSLDTIAMQNYTNANLTNNENLLFPLYIETLNGVPEPNSYGITSPSAYLQELQQNYTVGYESIMNDSYSYYGYFIYGTVGTFGGVNLPNVTANTSHVFVELGSSCS